MTIYELYALNPKFRAYIDRTCRSFRYKVDAEELLSHALIKEVAKQYENPDDTYTFGKIVPLSHLTNGDMIRQMSDEDLAEDRIDSMNRYRSPYKGWVGDFEGVRDTKENAVAAEIKWLRQES